MIRCLLLFALPVLLVQPNSSESCSIFMLSCEDEVVYGQNLDWHTAFPGQVVINKRGVRKTILPWKGHWPTTRSSEIVSWVSQYGSVTFTCYGRDFIEGGMNEKGLVVDETSLAAVYPPVDDRPGVSCPQWMQYQLDNFATVREVISHLDDLRPDGEGWHYLIADKTGDCAVIEYLSGEPVVFTGDDATICALTNTTYQQALSHLPLDTRFGGDIDIGAGNDSYGRFVRIAALLLNYSAERDGPATDYAFHILSDVSSAETRRSVVYNATGRCVSWTTEDNQLVRSLDLAALDFSRGTTTLVLDVDVGGPGDVAVLLTDFNTEENRTIVDAVLDSSPRNPETIQKLADRGLTFDEALELIARHPTESSR